MTFTIDELKEQVAQYKVQYEQGNAILTHATIAIRVVEHQIAVLEERKLKDEQAVVDAPITDSDKGLENAIEEGNE